MAVTSTGLTGRTNIIIQLQQKKQIDLNTVLDNLNINTGVNWSWGTLANQANLLYHDKIEAIPTGAGTEIDLGATDAQKDAFGDYATFSAVKLLYAKNLDTTNNLILFGKVTTGILIPSTAAAAANLVIPPLGFFLWSNPSAAGLVLGSEDILLLASSASTVDAEIAILGLKA